MRERERERKRRWIKKIWNVTRMKQREGSNIFHTFTQFRCSNHQYAISNGCDVSSIRYKWMAWHQWKCEVWMKTKLRSSYENGDAKAKMCTKYQNEENVYDGDNGVWKDARIERKPINTRRTFIQFISINRQRSGTNSIKVNNFNINACLCLYVNEVVDCRHTRFHNIFIIIVYKGSSFCSIVSIFFIHYFLYFFLRFPLLVLLINRAKDEDVTEVQRWSRMY